MSKRRGESQRTKQKVVRETHKTNNSSLTRRWLYEESNDALPGMRRPTIINQPTSPRRPSARSRDMKATRPQQKPQRTKQKVVRETHKTNNSSLTRRWLYEESNDTLPGGRRPTIINQPTSPRRPSARSLYLDNRANCPRHTSSYGNSKKRRSSRDLQHNR